MTNQPETPRETWYREEAERNGSTAASLLSVRDMDAYDWARLAGHFAGRVLDAASSLPVHPERETPQPACANCGCEERDHRGILTCRCPAPASPLPTPETPDEPWRTGENQALTSHGAACTCPICCPGKWAANAVTATPETPRGNWHDGNLYCYGGCGTLYRDFARDVLLPTALWNRIAVGPPFDETPFHGVDREGRGGVLCPACIVSRLAVLPECTARR